MITLTPAHIEQIRTPQGGYNQRTMELLGEWPLSEGWKERLVGRAIADKRWRQALKEAAIQSHRYRGNTQSPR